MSTGDTGERYRVGSSCPADSESPALEVGFREARRASPTGCGPWRRHFSGMMLCGTSCREPRRSRSSGTETRVERTQGAIDSEVEVNAETAATDVTVGTAAETEANSDPDPNFESDGESAPLLTPRSILTPSPDPDTTFWPC